MLQALDAAGAADWDYKQIVAYLEREHPEVSSGWWRQSITVGYERARGKRAVGETADAGFQVGVQRSVSATATEAWELITSRTELWLGQEASVAFETRERYEVPPGGGCPGASGEVRVVKPGARLGMTWQPEGWTTPATLQLTLSESRPGKTAIHPTWRSSPTRTRVKRCASAGARRWNGSPQRLAEPRPTGLACLDRPFGHSSMLGNAEAAITGAPTSA